MLIQARYITFILMRLHMEHYKPLPTLSLTSYLVTSLKAHDDLTTYRSVVDAL